MQSKLVKETRREVNFYFTEKIVKVNDGQKIRNFVKKIPRKSLGSAVGNLTNKKLPPAVKQRNEVDNFYQTAVK